LKRQVCRAASASKTDWVLVSIVIDTDFPWSAADERCPRARFLPEPFSPAFFYFGRLGGGGSFGRSPPFRLLVT
jgi:hypothetical protein